MRITKELKKGISIFGMLIRLWGNIYSQINQSYVVRCRTDLQNVTSAANSASVKLSMTSVNFWLNLQCFVVNWISCHRFAFCWCKSFGKCSNIVFFMYIWSPINLFKGIFFFNYISLYFVTSSAMLQIWYCQSYTTLGVKTAWLKLLC